MGSDIAAVGMVANRLGVSILSRQQVRFLGERVVWRDFQEDFHRTLGVATHAGRRPSPALAAFLRTVEGQEAER